MSNKTDLEILKVLVEELKANNKILIEEIKNLRKRINQLENNE